MENILTYKSKKTNSYISFVSENMNDIDTFCYLSKMMNYQEEKIFKNNIKKLATAILNVRKVKECEK